MRDAIRVTRDGREICLRSAAGKLEYKLRLLAMLKRQKGKCCLCRLPLSDAEATFEHENGRGMGGSKRDDRIVLPGGRWQNGAAHLRCNLAKGSRRILYNDFHNAGKK